MKYMVKYVVKEVVVKEVVVKEVVVKEVCGGCCSISTAKDS